MQREKRTEDLNIQLATRLNLTESSQARVRSGVVPLRDPIMLEHLTSLHDSIEATKASLSQTQEVLSSDMNTLLSKLDQAIDLVRERRESDNGGQLPQQRVQSNNNSFI